MTVMQNAGEVAQVSVVERWQWWQAAVKDPSKIGSEELPIHVGEYQLGYYRVVDKRSGRWVPVGIYPDGDGTVVAYRGDKPVADIAELFTWCCRHPISYEDYTKAMEGDGFEDEPPAPAEIGHNSGDDDPFEAITQELAGEAEMAREFLRSPVQTQADADKCGIWSKRIGELMKRADRERETEKAPHLAACREVDDKWRPVVSDAKNLARDLKDHIQPYLIEQKRKREEEARKAREEAERQRQEAAKAENEEAKAAALKAAQDAERAAKPKNSSAGRTGASVSIRVEKKGEITDYDALLMALKDRTEVKELVQSLANRAAKSGFELPGMKIIEVEKVV